eukprot:1210161-Prymnesium_polylepis.1
MSDVAHNLVLEALLGHDRVVPVLLRRLDPQVGHLHQPGRLGAVAAHGVKHCRPALVRDRPRAVHERVESMSLFAVSSVSSVYASAPCFWLTSSYTSVPSASTAVLKPVPFSAPRTPPL